MMAERSAISAEGFFGVHEGSRLDPCVSVHSFNITDMCCTSMKWAPAINTTVPHFLLLDSKLTSR